jgi:hypothetical protein
MSEASVAAIEAVLEETIGEKGIAVDYGWTLLGSIYVGGREVDANEPLPRLNDKPEYVELWATITLDEKDLIGYLRADAERNLKPGQRFEIRQRIPTRYGRSKGMAWYHNDAMDKLEVWDRVPAAPLLARGCYLVGEYTVPTP